MLYHIESKCASTVRGLFSWYSDYVCLRWWEST